MAKFAFRDAEPYSSWHEIELHINSLEDMKAALLSHEDDLSWASEFVYALCGPHMELYGDFSFVSLKNDVIVMDLEYNRPDECTLFNLRHLIVHAMPVV